MKKHMSITIITLGIAVIFIGVSAFLGIYTYQKASDLSFYFDGEKRNALLNQVSDQITINAKLEAIAKNRSYTIDNPYIELNPYQISPLSGIIIFQTKKSEKVEVYLNNEKMTTMEASKEHVIPIYGLYEDYENEIKLIVNNKEYKYLMKTKKSDIEYPLEIVKKSKKYQSDDMIFTVASYKTFLTGWDSFGKLRFYLTVDNRMDVEWLENGHFLIGTSQGQFAEQFMSFVEMDYLGKIYNYYIPENGSSFEFQILKNGNILNAGGKTPVYIKEQVIYELDPKTGKKVDDVNIYEIFKEIDPDFTDKYLGQPAVRNGFYYDEEKDDLIVSFRGINTVFCLSFKNKKLKWIFTNPDNPELKKELWKKYKVKSKNNYPWGQHSPIITSDGNIGFFNNGYDRYNGFEVGGEDKTIKYAKNYSRAEIYKIKDMTAKLVWSYDYDKKIFSHQYGSLNITPDNHKLVDFGYVLDEDYRRSANGTLSESEQNPDHISAIIVEIDDKGDVLLEAKCEEGKYRAFKHALYNKITFNTDVKKLNMFNNLVEDEIEESKMKNSENKQSYEEWIYTVDFTKNTFTTNYEIKEDDEIKLVFMNKTGKLYTMTYKEKTNPQLKRIFNINIPHGDYAMFVSLNNRLYFTDKVISF